MLADTWVSSDITVFFDRDGYLTKDFCQNRWLTLFYNSDQPEIALEGQPAQHDLCITDYRKGRIAAIGLYSQVIRPGQGVVMLDAGRVLFEYPSYGLTLVVGHHDPGRTAWRALFVLRQ